MPPKPIIKATLVKTGSRTDNRTGGHPHALKKGNKGMSRIMEDDKKNPKIPEEHSFSEQEENLQLQERELSEQELNQDVQKMLQPNNPQAPHNMTQYSFRERVFKKDELVDQLVIHFSTDGDFIHKESNEFKTQDEINENRASAINEAKRAMAADDPSARREAESEEGLKKLKRTLRNKFNYNERQSQTVNETVRDRGVSTQPPPVKRLAMELTQWDIYDSYVTEFSKDEPLRIATADGGSIKVENGVVKPPANAGTDKSIYPASFRRSMKIMERMVVQNIEQEKYHDYKYYFTEKDMPDISNAEGSILPIWRITSEKQRKKHVTSLAWNPRYSDFFAVGLGSYNFNRQAGQGYICCYSLKNTKYPEYFFTTPKGVMSIDFHPKSPALLAVGLYDGTVMVFDIRSKHKKPIYKSTVRTMKHTEPVWQVYWNPDNTKNYSFFSISSDGRVTQWVLMKNKLEPEDMMKLKLVADSTGEDGSNLIGYACGLCFDFNKFEPGIFLVGTEEGKIHKCNLAYSGQYQETYEGHIQAVYKVRWNNFHSKTFISASADWTVKVWDSRYKTPIISIDLGTQVVDAAWSPCSSVVFSVCTLDKIQVYDLIFDKLGKRAETKPTKQAKLTNLVFSAKDPVILVGDDHGGVTVLKLSPNLTPHMVKTGNNEVVPEGKTVQQYEEEKMENMLNLVGKFEKDDM